MFKVATSVKQAPWECKWARAGHRLLPDPEHGHPENLWICVRPSPEGRRVVSDEQCEHCPHWSAGDDDTPCP